MQGTKIYTVLWYPTNRHVLSCRANSSEQGLTASLIKLYQSRNGLKFIPAEQEYLTKERTKKNL